MHPDLLRALAKARHEDLLSGPRAGRYDFDRRTIHHGSLDHAG